MAKKNTKVRYFGTGRRKTSVARVILQAGEGKVTVNGRAFEEYITNPLARLDALQPLELTENLNKFDVIVNVFGGGMTGQAGAIRLGRSTVLRRLVVLHNSLRDNNKFDFDKKFIFMDYIKSRGIHNPAFSFFL